MSDEPLVLSEEEGRAALRWVRENPYVGLLEVLVSTRAYTGDVEPAWCLVGRVKHGDGSPYPVVARIPRIDWEQDGQWSLTELLGVRITATHQIVAHEQHMGNMPRGREDPPMPVHPHDAEGARAYTDEQLDAALEDETSHARTKFAAWVEYERRVPSPRQLR